MNPKMTAADAARTLGITLQAIHKQIRTKNLHVQKSQNRIFFGHETARAFFKYNFHQKTVASQIVKGGTGKTSLLYSIGIRANLFGARVLYIDMDQQGNLTQSFHLDPEQLPCMVDTLQEDIPLEEAIVDLSPGLSIIPSRIENAILDNTLMLKRLPLDRVYRQRFDALRKRYDLILIDCPPALGQSVAAVALAADLIIAPVTPERYSLSGLQVTIGELENLEDNYKCSIPIRIVVNKFDNRTILSHEVLSTLMKHEKLGDLLFKSYVRNSQEFQNSIAKGTTIFDTLRATSAKEDVDLLTQELLEIGSFANEMKKKAAV